MKNGGDRVDFSCDWYFFCIFAPLSVILVMLVIVNNEHVERAVLGSPMGDMPQMCNDAVTFHEALRAP